jgi:uncharacterized membrane protein YGL010W
MNVPSKKVDLLLADYALYHRTKGSIICHYFGISMIVYGLFSFLQLLPVWKISCAELLLFGSAFYYLTLDVKLGLAALGGFAILDAAARAAVSPGLGLFFFVLGWIFQGIGHAVFEKKSPAFFKNLIHLMIGPLFLLNEAFHLRKVSPSVL